MNASAAYTARRLARVGKRLGDFVEALEALADPEGPGWTADRLVLDELSIRLESDDVLLQGSLLVTTPCAPSNARLRFDVSARLSEPGALWWVYVFMRDDAADDDADADDDACENAVLDLLAEHGIVDGEPL